MLAAGCVGIVGKYNYNITGYISVLLSDISEDIQKLYLHPYQQSILGQLDRLSPLRVVGCLNNQKLAMKNF